MASSQQAKPSLTASLQDVSVKRPVCRDDAYYPDRLHALEYIYRSSRWKAYSGDTKLHLWAVDAVLRFLGRADSEKWSLAL